MYMVKSNGSTSLNDYSSKKRSKYEIPQSEGRIGIQVQNLEQSLQSDDLLTQKLFRCILFQLSFQRPQIKFFSSLLMSSEREVWQKMTTNEGLNFLLVLLLFLCPRTTLVIGQKRSLQTQTTGQFIYTIVYSLESNVGISFVCLCPQREFSQTILIEILLTSEQNILQINWPKVFTRYLFRNSHVSSKMLYMQAFF